jgi:hypothetical protein
MNKKAFGFELAKDLIILTVVIAFLIVLATQTLEVVDTQSKIGVCGVSAVVTDLSGRLSEGTAKPKWQCPIDGPNEITLSDLASKPPAWLPQATKEAYSSNDNLEMDLLSDERLLAQYNLNKIVSEKIRDCYLKTGFSKAELFSNWYAFIGLDEEIEDPSFFDEIVPTNYQFEYPVGCGICSALYLESDALSIFDGSPVIPDLATYMARHPQNPTSTDSLLDFTELRGDGLFTPDLTYTVGGVEDQMYVVIQRHEIHQALKWFEKADGLFKGAINLIPGADLASYKDEDGLKAYVTFRVLKGSDLNNECAFIANEFEEE